MSDWDNFSITDSLDWSAHPFFFGPDSIELDSSWKAARAFSVITLIFAVIIITIKVSAAALLKR